MTSDGPGWRGTTILGVAKDGKVCVAAPGSTAAAKLR